jgi:hypothetical protein
MRYRAFELKTLDYSGSNNHSISLQHIHQFGESHKVEAPILAFSNLFWHSIIKPKASVYFEIVENI